MLTLRSKAFSKMRVHSARRRSTLIKAWSRTREATTITKCTIIKTRAQTTWAVARILLSSLKTLTNVSPPRIKCTGLKTGGSLWLLLEVACRTRPVRDQASRGVVAIHQDPRETQDRSTIYQIKTAKMLRHLITLKTSTRRHQTKMTTTQTPVHPLAASPTTNASEGPENGEALQKKSTRRVLVRRVWYRGMARSYLLYSAIVAVRGLSAASWRRKSMTITTCLKKSV